MTTKIGRPTKLTPELQEKFCEIISKGHYISTACEALDIGTTTYKDWMTRAENGDDSYRSFSSAVKNAQAKRELRLLSRIESASAIPQYWQSAAWMLERSMPDKYSKRDRISVTAQIGPMLEQIANPPIREQIGNGEGSDG